MEFFFLLPMLVLVTLSIYLALHIFINKHKPQSITNDKKIPLPPGRTGWPLIGESLDYLSKIQDGAIEKFVTERKNKYSSKVFKTSLIGEPMAVLCGPQGNKFLFSNEKKLVQVWFPSSIEKIFPKSNDAPNSAKKIPSFLKTDALRRFVGVMDTVMKRHLQTDWDCDHVKVYLMARKYTFTLACRLFLSIDDPIEIEKITKFMEDIEACIFSLPINLPGTALNRAIRTSKVLRKQIEAMVKQRKIDLSEKKASPTQDILSQMLLTVDEDGQYLNESDISSHLVGFLFGGYSTVKDTITFIMKYLAELPHVYQEVFREQMGIANSKEPNELLNWEDLRKMKYSWNVANEVLRVMPPGTGMFRESITDFTYAGHMIPKGWKLHWIMCDTHKDPKYFPNPDNFDPTRFEGNGPAPYTFVPFGGGPRMCPGNEYARLAILVFMHNVVKKFRWEKLILNEKVVNYPFPRPAQGLPIRLYHHKP